MPQMSPMDWLMLMLYFFMIYFMFLVNIYFIMKIYLTNIKKELNCKNFFLKWY